MTEKHNDELINLDSIHVPIVYPDQGGAVTESDNGLVHSFLTIDGVEPTKLAEEEI